MPSSQKLHMIKAKLYMNVHKAKLYMNVHWMVLYKFKVFCSDMKFKMAATGLSLTGPYGENVSKCFF